MHHPGHQQQIFTYQFENGLTLLAEPMPWLESVSIAMAVPAGYRNDPPEKQGLANLVSEMAQRGCGDFDSRQFMEELERNGIDFRSNVANYHAIYSATLQHQRLTEAVALLIDLLRKARLEEDQFEDAKLTCLQDIRALEDDLHQKVYMELSRLFYGTPDGNCCEGTETTLANIQLEDVIEFYHRHYSPQQSIITVAGKFDWDQLRKLVESLVADWQGPPPPAIDPVPPSHGYQHIPFESEQTQIAIAYPAVPYCHPDYYLCRGAIGVLSGGMSSRLFHEVREKRGLCYSVFANCHSLKDRGGVFVYSGTSNERAQQTLDVIMQQIESLHQGIHADELRRLKIQLKTNLVAEQESSRSRANGLASDWFYLGYLRSLASIEQAIEALTVDRINDYLNRNPPSFFDIVTLGNQSLNLPRNGISTTSTN